MAQCHEELFARRAPAARALQIRRKSADAPRLSVFRSGQHIYAQVIDDAAGVTLAAASSLDKESEERAQDRRRQVEAAKAVGKLIAERAIAAGVKEVVFDRGGYLFHGRVKALADAAREGGLSVLGEHRVWHVAARRPARPAIATAAAPARKAS